MHSLGADDATVGRPARTVQEAANDYSVVQGVPKRNNAPDTFRLRSGSEDLCPLPGTVSDERTGAGLGAVEHVAGQSVGQAVNPTEQRGERPDVGRG